MIEHKDDEAGTFQRYDVTLESIAFVNDVIYEIVEPNTNEPVPIEVHEVLDELRMKYGPML